MEPIVAKCGYRCDLCLSHEVNLKGENDKRRMSEALEKYYGAKLPAEEVKPCKGCRDARETPDKECQVFPCVREKNIANCAHCEEFGNCEKLKTRMDAVEEFHRKFTDIPEDDYKLFFKPYLSRSILMKIRKTLGEQDGVDA